MAFLDEHDLAYDLFSQLDALVVQLSTPDPWLVPPGVTAVLERARAQFAEDCWKQLIRAAIYLQREGEIAYQAYYNCMREDPVVVVRARRGAVLFTLTDHDGPLYQHWIQTSDAFQWLTIRLMETSPKSVAQGMNSPPWKT